MINELNEMVISIENLNRELGIILVTRQEINEALGYINEYKADITLFKNSIQTILALKDNSNQKAEQAIVYFNLHLGDVIQDLQNIQQLLDTAAKRYVEYLEQNVSEKN